MRTIASLLCFVLGTLWPPAGFAQVRLFASVVPLKYFAERVGGEHVLVKSMVQPGHSPVTYEPTTRQMAGLALANAYLRIGVPFESVWMERIRAANPGLTIIDVRDGVDMVPLQAKSQSIQAAEGEHRDHDHQGMDPHIWLDPAIAITIAFNIRDYLARFDPQNTNKYNENTEHFVRELTDLDDRIKVLFEESNCRRFLVFHPAWGYFARAYGLDQLAVEYEGKAPGPRTLVRLVELAKREGIATIFVQKQFSDRMSETLAAEIGAEVVVLDPLAENYVENLLAAARAISGLSPQIAPDRP